MTPLFRRPAGLSDWKVLFLFLFLVCTRSFVLLLCDFGTSESCPPLLLLLLVHYSSSSYLYSYSYSYSHSLLLLLLLLILLFLLFYSYSYSHSFLLPVLDRCCQWLVKWSTQHYSRLAVLVTGRTRYKPDRPVLICYGVKRLLKSALATQAASALRPCLRLRIFIFFFFSSSSIPVPSPSPSLFFPSVLFSSLNFPSLLFSSLLCASLRFTSLRFPALLSSPLLFPSLPFPSLLFSSLLFSSASLSCFHLACTSTFFLGQPLSASTRSPSMHRSVVKPKART